MHPNGISTEPSRGQPAASRQVFAGMVQPRPTTNSGQAVRAGAGTAEASADGNYMLCTGEKLISLMIFADMKR